MRSRFAVFAGIVALSAWTIGMSAHARDHAAGQAHAAGQDHDHANAQQHEAGAHTHPEAAKLKNPVKATPESIAAGKKIYDAQCTSCHGETGKGDGKMAASITGEKPADLSDASWKHGSSDGEIFTLIRDGSKGTGMRGFATKLKTDDIWNVVNYLRTLGPKPAKSH
jgi:mono/diheme cytochrome c family protein